MVGVKTHLKGYETQLRVKVHVEVLIPRSHELTS